jgi:hypothetical protein
MGNRAMTIPHCSRSKASGPVEACDPDTAWDLPLLLAAVVIAVVVGFVMCIREAWCTLVATLSDPGRGPSDDNGIGGRSGDGPARPPWLRGSWMRIFRS